MTCDPQLLFCLDYQLGLGLGNVPGEYSMFIPHVLGWKWTLWSRGGLA
ncbi:hypothetical protein HanIR_Chr06g0286541 [Helianthus annuus]|nr:hypothetical protein HanIR_Chr06g0286541 [Helianthus annuus]